MNNHRSVNVYRHLLTLYPKSFRSEYGDDLVALFTQQLRDERAASVWLFAIHDLIVSISSQHLEAHMKHRTSQTFAALATMGVIAALVLALAAGTGPIVGVFLLIAIVSLVIATLSWNSARPIGPADMSSPNRWRTLLIAGVILLALVMVVINVPPFSNRELPEAGWLLMMTSLVTSVGLITVGLTMGFAHRSARHHTVG
jgi:hypothetical protein